MHPPTEVLGAMITPAVLISAAALLLLSTASRLGRVNDRLQHLLTEAERLLSHSVGQEQKEILSFTQWTCLEDRLALLRSAIIALYVTIALPCRNEYRRRALRRIPADYEYCANLDGNARRGRIPLRHFAINPGGMDCSTGYFRGNRIWPQTFRSAEAMARSKESRLAFVRSQRDTRRWQIKRMN